MMDEEDQLIQDRLHDSLASTLLRVREVTGHDFSFYKEKTIARRISRHMQTLGLTDIGKYVEFLSDNDNAVEALFREFLIGVTDFFRDSAAFEVLKGEVLGDYLIKKKRDSELRVWIPGCSTGEEAYSIAIILYEAMEEARKHFKVQIFATDIDSYAIDVARKGIYPNSLVKNISNERLERFFIKCDSGYQVQPFIRNMLIFATQNIIQDPSFTRLDLICCRNLFIYLTPAIQRQLVPLFHYSLCKSGILFLGSCEAITTFTEYFTPLNKKWRIFKRHSAVSSQSELINLPRNRRLTSKGVSEALHNCSEDKKSCQQITEFSGDNNTLVGVDFSGDDTLDICAQPQAVVEELEITNQELKSANEELQSMNEELQSTNEELETSKEEQRSLNEELSSLNEELNYRVQTLINEINIAQRRLDDLGVAILFLDENLCIRKFTPAMLDYIHLISTDIGRPIADINIAFECRHFTNLLKDCFEDGNESSLTIRHTQGGILYLRLVPYKHVGDSEKDKGLVILIEDITKMFASMGETEVL